MAMIKQDVKGTSMVEEQKGGEEGRELSEKELEEQLKALQHAQQVYIEQAFKWLIDFVASYFPEDQLAIRDMDLEIHFIHRVVEGGKTLGALVYRFRKFVNKAEYFKEMAEDYQDGLELPEVFFVDTESSKFEEPKAGESGGDFTEIPPDKLTGRI
ncbi:MAG TPA: hypothetical protein VJ873_07670, partial [bacterium]|nr:hypothetical protein [bacterium]